MRAVLLLLAIVIAAVVLVGFAPQTAGAQEYHGLPGFVPTFDAGNPLFVGPGNAATTVQLPTFSFFTISTTVNVPDRGSAFLGGVDRSTGNIHTSGPPGLANRAGASGVAGGGVSVSAQIIDLRAMDKQLLAEAAAEREASARFEATQQWAARIERARQSTAGRPAISVAAARQASVSHR
ncbi:MAG: hypothetical protein JNK76_08960 [Planctomycetales bacterium]|nr:hypothetical protein [Planctomycetales bacterium]MBN8628298.1 hypothetical protein [Planctomycetota bacterium]